MTLYQIVTEATYNDTPGNDFVNVYTYDVNDVVPSSINAFFLTEAFYTTVVDDAAGWKSVVTANMDMNRIVTTAPQFPTVVAVKPVFVTGSRTGQPLPLFNAWSFKSERTRADIRAGFKRYGTISETDVSGFVPATGMLTVLEAFAGILSAELEFTTPGGDFIATPIIVKRVKYTTPSGSVAYRMPQPGDPYEFSQAVNWVYDSVTSQNSRKR